MKKLISFALVLAMVCSLAACGCQHDWQDATCTTPKTCAKCGETEGEALGHRAGNEAVTAVDTENLTVTYAIACKACGKELESRSGSTGDAPVNGVLTLSPDEWYDCLLTIINNYGAGQSLYSYPVESEDNVLLKSLVTMSQMNAVFSFMDAQENVIRAEQSDDRSSIHNIRMDAQFTNDNAKEFYMLLMLLAIHHNAALEPEAASTLAGQIMSGTTVTDNGFTYAMEVVSVEEHRVCVSITAE